MMITSCPKCVAHFECLKFEGDPSYDFEITDIVSFLAKQIEEKKTLGSGATEIINNTSTDEATA